MAVLTDVLIAPPSDAPAIIAQWPAAKNWPSYQSTGIDWLVLAELAEALGQGSLGTEIENLAPAASRDVTNGPWVYVLPIALRDRIADISPDDIDRLAKAWSEKEEASARGLTPQVAEKLLRGLQSIAIRARDSRRPLLLWISS